MCEFLKVPRSLIYYHLNKEDAGSFNEESILKIIWNYVCTIIDLSNREIIGYSAGANKDADLVEKAILSCRYSLNDIRVFHSDRGKEYDKKTIDEVLETFNIERS